MQSSTAARLLSQSAAFALGRKHPKAQKLFHR